MARSLGAQPSCGGFETGSPSSDLSLPGMRATDDELVGPAGSFKRMRRQDVTHLLLPH
jgi:hypothetical protein